MYNYFIDCRSSHQGFGRQGRDMVRQPNQGVAGSEVRLANLETETPVQIREHQVVDRTSQNHPGFDSERERKFRRLFRSRFGQTL